jgi:hypothetical protein
VSRKGGNPHPRRTKPGAAQGADGAVVSVLPMDIQVGDRFTDEEGDWEVVSHPATLHSAKSLRAGVRRAEKPAAERDVTWPARVEIGAVRNRERRPMSQLFGLASSSINVTHHGSPRFTPLSVPRA